jgi:HlyD family secretion protein
MAHVHNAKLRQLLLLVFVAILILMGIGYLATPVFLGEKIGVFQLQRGELIQTVVASGRIENPARVDISTQVTGRVISVPVKEGQKVQTNQPLIELDSADERAALEQTGAVVRQAEVKLAQFREQIEPMAQQSLQQAQANLAAVQKQYDRTRDLVGQNFVGKAQLDEAQRNLDVARSQFDSALLQLKSASPSGSEYLLANAALAQAHANFRAAEARFGHTKITAISDGVLIARDVERGDIVQPGKILMVMSPVGLSQCLVQIDEKNLRFLKIGQAAQVMADAYPGQKFAAQVAFINPGINAQRGSVDVKLNIANPPVFLQQDMTVSIEIEVARSKDALSLNVEAIRDAASSKPWVMLVENGKAVRRTITLGMLGDKNSEIVSGLAATDLVLPATGIMVKEGDRVRALIQKANTNGVKVR